MSTTTPVRKRRRRKMKKTPLTAILAGVALVCSLAGGIAALERALTPEETLPTEPATTTETLPENPYRTAEFTYNEKGYLTCADAATRVGIDVSDHQQEIDWAQVADAGIEFAFIRIGYRGYSEGGIYPDENAARNIKNAQAAGLDVGVYFYSQAISPEEAAEEAEFCLEALDGTTLQLPVVYDWEYVSADARTGAMDRATLTQCALRFCEAVSAGGFDAMIYANPDIAGNYLDLKALQGYPFWLALYADTMDYPYRAEFWQYTAAGSVPGITGDVDINLQFTG